MPVTCAKTENGQPAKKKLSTTQIRLLRDLSHDRNREWLEVTRYEDNENFIFVELGSITQEKYGSKFYHQSDTEPLRH